MRSLNIILSVLLGLFLFLGCATKEEKQNAKIKMVNKWVKDTNLPDPMGISCLRRDCDVNINGTIYALDCSIANDRCSLKDND